MLLTHALGVLLLSAGPWFTAITSLPTEDSLFYGFLFVSVLTIVVPIGVNFW